MGKLNDARSRSRYVTVAEVADLLRVSNMTVYRLVQAGQLPAVRVGRSYRIREEDVDSYVAAQYTVAGSNPEAPLPKHRDFPVETTAPRPSCVVSLLTDYGLDDGFVGALHSVLRRRLPEVPIVDLTHGVAPQDVRAGSLALRRVAPYLAPGVVVAVVDPGVGTARRAVAVATRDVVFIGPDNGLLVPAFESLGGGSLAVELEDRGYWLKTPGPTFAGRDVFAPAAAELAAGMRLADLGPAIPLASLARLPEQVARRRPDGSLEAEVSWVDRYGNIHLAAGPQDLSPPPVPGDTLNISRSSGADEGDGARTWPARVARTFADLAPGQLGLVVDSYGCLDLCLFGASAARQLGLEEQDLVVLSPV